MTYLPAPPHSWLITHCSTYKEVDAQPLLGWHGLDDQNDYANPVVAGDMAERITGCNVCGGLDTCHAQVILGPATAAEVSAILKAQAVQAKAAGIYTEGVTTTIRSAWGQDLLQELNQ